MFIKPKLPIHWVFFMVFASGLSSALGQTSSYLINGSFESFKTGDKSYLTAGGGTSSGNTGLWQLTFVGNNSSCTGVSCGTSEIIDTSTINGSKALGMVINKHTNRNDIKLLQVIGGTIPKGKYVLSFWMRSTQAEIPVTANVLKSSEGITSNGGLATLFASSIQWQQYKMYVDLSSWTDLERTKMRISIRPNTVTSTVTPKGPYPKTFLFDDISFAPINALNEMRDIAVQIAQDRRKASLDSGYVAEANQLNIDIELLKTTELRLPVALPQSLGFFPTIKATNNNIFINAVHTWAADYLSTAFSLYPKSTSKNYTSYPKATSNSGIYPNNTFEDTRNIGRLLEQLYWLILSPNSRYQYNPELFRRFLLLVYATADDYAIRGYSSYGGIPGSNFGSAINDWFAISSISNTWRLSDLCFEQFLPNTIRSQIRQAARRAGSQHYKWAQDIFEYHYTNRDLSYAEVLMNTGLHLDSVRWVNMAKLIIDAIHQVDLYPDGAFSYFKKQNEVPNYHHGNVSSMIKLWVVSDYGPALECVRKAANYEMLAIENQEVPEFYTSSAWKTNWNTLSGYSPDALVYITQNPWLKTKFDSIYVTQSISASPMAIPFYDPNLKGRPLPEQYIVYDRNIQGPRYRGGPFSYAITTRNVAPSNGDVGLQTMGGAMVTQRRGLENSLNASLMAVHAKVHVRKVTEDEWRDWGYLSSKIQPRTNMTRKIAAVSSTGILQYQDAGPFGRETNWASYEQWITLPDRMICLLEVYPKNTTGTTEAFEIDARVRFTYGRSGGVYPQTMRVDEAGKRYSYGNLTAIVHQHDFTQVDVVNKVGIIRDSDKFATEIRFRYDLSNGGSAAYSYPATTRKYVIIEVRSNTAEGEVSVTRIANANYRGLIVEQNGKRYASFRNLKSTTQQIDLSPAVLPGVPSRMHFSRGDAISTPSVPTTGATYPLKANDQILIVSSTSAEDTIRSWHNYNELLLYKPDNCTVKPLASFNVNYDQSCRYLKQYGDLSVIPGQGNPPYSFLWSNGSTNTSVTDSLSHFRNYYVRIQDALGCSSIISPTMPISESPSSALEGTMTAEVDCPSRPLIGYAANQWQKLNVAATSSSLSPPNDRESVKVQYLNGRFYYWDIDSWKQMDKQPASNITIPTNGLPPGYLTYFNGKFVGWNGVEWVQF